MNCIDEIDQEIEFYKGKAYKAAKNNCDLVFNYFSGLADGLEKAKDILTKKPITSEIVRESAKLS